MGDVDLYNLRRFVDAQEQVYMEVLAELHDGRKQTHWVWFIFPQISGLGHSAIARKFAITSLDEAEAYLRHTILGPRLRECVELVNDSFEQSIDQIMGPVDALKFRSCVTLFLVASKNDRLFQMSLERFFSGEADPLTLNRLDNMEH